MATVTLKNIPERLYERLKLLAKVRHRSINSEIIYNLEKSLGVVQAEKNDLIEQVRDFRERIKMKGELTPEEIDQAINEGRP
jgi:antitoxin FitA